VLSQLVNAICREHGKVVETDEVKPILAITPYLAKDGIFNCKHYYILWLSSLGIAGRECRGILPFSSKNTTLLLSLKVPKHEIFNGGFFASKEPIWSPDS
jgi:hypothetical protein